MSFGDSHDEVLWGQRVTAPTAHNTLPGAKAGNDVFYGEKHPTSLLFDVNTRYGNASLISFVSFLGEEARIAVTHQHVWLLPYRIFLSYFRYRAAAASTTQNDTTSVLDYLSVSAD